MYLLTNRGTLMPCTTEGVTTETGLVEVTSPNGAIYTANPGNLVSQEDGAHMLRQRRAEQLLSEGYEICLQSDGAVRMFQEKKHGRSGGYILRPNGDGDYACDCPDACKRDPFGCKHALGLPALLRAREMRLAAIRAHRAAMIARDGWNI